MNTSDHPEPLGLPRRTVLTRAGAGIGAGLLAGVATPAPAKPTSGIWIAEYWTKKSSKKGEVKLNLWRKRFGAPICATSAPRRRWKRSNFYSVATKNSRSATVVSLGASSDR